MENNTTHHVFDLFSPLLNNLELKDSENEVDELYALCDDPMQYPVKMIDEQLRFTDLVRLQDLFVENTGFLVVGAIGLQGCGKSTLLNVLANRITNNTTPFDGPFKVQTMENFTTNSPQTGGIDLYVTQDRVILLDAQPLMSFALTNYHTRAANSSSCTGQMDITPTPSNNGAASSGLSGPGSWSLDVWAEMASLQIIAFLLNCCHVVLVVSDEIGNAPLQLHRLVDRAAGLKPTVYTPSVIPQFFRQCRQPRSQMEVATLTTECNQPVGSKDHSSSALNSSKGPVLADGRFKEVTMAPGVFNATATVTGSYAASTSQTDEDEVETEDIDDPDDGGLVGVPQDRHRLTHSASDEQNGTVAPSGLLQARRTSTVQRETENQDAESSDVAAALSRLLNMTDYSASLIHVYNQAPSSAFLDPEVCSKLHAYQHELLPTLYPEARRLASMMTLGPRILFAHLTNSRHPSRSVEKSLTGAVPADSRLRETISGVAEAFSEASALSETADQPLNTAVAASGDGVIETARSAEPSACSASSIEPNISDRLISHDPNGIRPTEDDNTRVNGSVGSLISHHKHFDSPDGEVEEVSITMNSGDKCHQDEHENEAKTEFSLIRVPTSNFAKSESPPIKINLHSSVPCSLNEDQTGGIQMTATSTDKSSQNPTHISQRVNRSETASANLKGPHAPSEAELVAELHAVLREVEYDVRELLRRPLSSSSGQNRQANHSFSDSSLSSEFSDSDPEALLVADHLDGERLNARLARLTHQIQSVRRQFFDVQQRLNHPRLFCVPEVNSDGHTPTGCPSYASAARVLQEAIMSTPRQHMMLQFTERKWIAYAQKMWEAVCNSPLFSDYHAVLTNRA